MTSGRPRLRAVRRAVGLAVVLVLLGCAFAFYRAAPTLRKSAVPQPASAAGATPTSGLTTPAPPSAGSVGPTPGSGATARRDAAPGPGGSAVGIYLTATPAADGSFDVAESVVLPSPVSVLQLRVPPVGDGGSVFTSVHARATDVHVSASSQPVTVPDAEIGADVDLPLTAAATKFELRYRLTGVTIRSPGSMAGRALAALGPLTSGVPPDLPVATAVPGRTVLNLRCPHLPLGEQACSAGSDGNLRVNRTLPWRQSVVVVQLDLPRP
jgi:hypothetical protein